ncbi:Uncharacterized protein APZ42_033853 [Daphnia magna]|uniref:Uncharacterized protein n=1 Tax=Daphnia magna TaxID=35525 RepID=A0A164KMJ9_9CRUS|nr:Uncharacterized protein APZ42_033853 [Daphnia magna]
MQNHYFQKQKLRNSKLSFLLHEDSRRWNLVCFAAGACRLRHHWPGVLLSDVIWSSVSTLSFQKPLEIKIIAALKARIEQLEQENDYLHHQIDDSEVLTKSLKSEIVELKNKQPENLIDKLQAAISLVDGIRNNETDAAGAVAAASSRRSSKPNNMVYIVQGHSLRINTSDLKFAITIGRLSNGNLNAMVNKIMESVYTQIYMSEHSLSGLPPRVSKAQKDTVA